MWFKYKVKYMSYDGERELDDKGIVNAKDYIMAMNYVCDEYDNKEDRFSSIIKVELELISYEINCLSYDDMQWV